MSQFSQIVLMKDIQKKANEILVSSDIELRKQTKVDNNFFVMNISKLFFNLDKYLLTNNDFNSHLKPDEFLK